MRGKISSFIVLTFVAALVAVVPATPATAQSGGTCTVSGGVTVSHPLSMDPSSGTFEFTSDTTLTCVGVLGGQPVAGSGVVTASGNYGNGELAAILGQGDTCAYGSGRGTFSANVPRVGGGTVTVTGFFDFIRVGSAIELNGEAVAGGVSGPLAGLFQFTPDLGQDCFLTPVTSANVSGQAVVAGG